MPLIAPLIETPPPVRVPPRFQRLSMTWTGWDGSVWDLTDWSKGVFLTTGGTRGLLMPPVDRYTTSSPAVAGSIWRGSRTNERECFWPLYVYADSGSADWLDRDRAFWATLQPGVQGAWTVSTPDGASRTLQCRFSEAEDSIDQDPVVRGWMLYGVTLVAEQPYWLGPLSYRPFSVGAGAPFFPADWMSSPPDGSVLFISPSTTLSSASIDNPGDLDAPLVYVLEGPWDAGASVGVGSATTVYASSIPAGVSIVVDMRTSHLGAWSMATPSDPGGSPGWWQAVNAADTNVLSNLSKVALNVSVPPGRSRQLTVFAAGAGTVHVALEPRYWRAW